MSLLAIENLHMAIHGFPVLKGVTLRVAAGEVLGVIGESGSGKSMTAFSVMQLLPEGATCSGQILLDAKMFWRWKSARFVPCAGVMWGWCFKSR